MKRFTRIVTIAAFIFLYVPMIVLIFGAFNEGKSLFRFDGFTLDNFVSLFQSSTYLPLLVNSLIVALISSVIATILGTTACLGIHSMGKKARKLIMSVTNIPMTNPDIVTGVSLALLFAFFGNMMKISNILSFWTLIIAHITFNLPYVILSVMPKISQMDPNLKEAALDLGCTPFGAFRRVIIYELMPGIISGALLSFTMSLDDFVISYFVTGSDFVTLPIEIYNYTKKRIPTEIYALFTLMFVLILVGMIIMSIIQSRDSKKRELTKI